MVAAATWSLDNFEYRRTKNVNTGQAKLIDPATILKVSSKRALNLIHLNVRSISKKRDDLDLVENCGIGFQMIMLAEDVVY